MALVRLCSISRLLRNSSLRCWKDGNGSGVGVQAVAAGGVVGSLRHHARSLSVHEHHSMQLLGEYGVSVPAWGLADSPEKAAQIAANLGREVVVKAQVLAGGRRKGHFDTGLQGGVQFIEGPEEVGSVVKQMIGSKLITKQTGEKGRLCNKVMVCERLYFDKEFYLAIVMDRATMGPVILASSAGGVNIEELAVSSPDKIITEPIDFTTGLQTSDAARVAEKLGFSPSNIDSAADQIRRLYEIWKQKDATMVEINPFVEDKQGRVMCMDAKILFDDNAEFRQREMFQLRDWSQEDPREVEAADAGISYISLDGNIGCLVNGAGLAMASMDIIQLYGGSPANFLDIGGGASSDEVLRAFKIFNHDSHISAIFVNIFGGIVHCDQIAAGIIKATHQLQIKVPIVIRLQGNKQKEAKALVEASGLRQLLAQEDFDLAAKKVVEVSSAPV